MRSLITTRMNSSMMMMSTLERQRLSQKMLDMTKKMTRTTLMMERAVDISRVLKV